jgi:FAD-linked sulfhydryl oxidase
MDTKIWGPSAWRFMHSITLNYPEFPTKEDQSTYKIFFESIKNVLPCNTCKAHYKENLNKYPLTPQVLKTRRTLVCWLIDLHNLVNLASDPPKPTWTYAQVLKQYEKL